MTRNTRPLRRALAALTVAVLATGGVVALAAPASAAEVLVYNSIPASPPPASPSLGFQATSTDEFGDYVQLDGSDRVVSTVTVGLTDWACGNWEAKALDGATPCLTEPAATFSHPITLSLYEVDNSGADPTPGAVIASITQDADIPFRPSASVECTDDKWFDAGTATCYNGFDFTLDFDFSSFGAVLGDDVIVGVAYNTQTYGAAPIGVNGPYNSLNVSLAGAAPTVGTDETQDEMFWDTTYPGYTDEFLVDTGWGDYNGLVLSIATDADLVPAPSSEETVYQKDVKSSETVDTYLFWHEGKNNPTPRYSVQTDGLHLGDGSASTIIKGTDVPNSEVSKAALRALIIAGASVTVESGSTTFQVPVHFGAAWTDNFTTLRSTSLTAGTHTFSLSDTWATTRAFGPYSAQEEAPLGELLDAIFEYDSVWLAGFGVQADSLAIVSKLAFNDTTYTFYQPEMVPCTPSAGTTVSNLDSTGWDFSQTRSQGFYEFVETGLHVYTGVAGGSPDPRKAAGYHAVDIALTDIGTPSIVISDGYSGVRPSLQLGFDADGDGNQDAYLVGEPWAYGGGSWTPTVNGDWADAKFWASGNADFGVGAGGGYASMGTLADYLLANPEARITSYGFSLGSGVDGDAIIESITVGCATATFAFELDTLAPPTVQRLAGADRYATAIEISQYGFIPEDVDIVYIATGQGFADALSAAPAAAHDGAPLLLTKQATLPAAVKAELERLTPSKIIVVGGTGAVSDTVFNQLTALGFSPTVVRVFGADRYATSRAIATSTWVSATSAYIATGRNFPDALSAGPAAAHFDGPVILVPGTASSLDSATLGVLDDLSVTDVKIAGGTAVVSAGIQSSLSAFTVTRNFGADRYATAVAINEDEFDTTLSVFVATGAGFADALTGAALAGVAGAPLYVSTPNCIPPTVLQSILDRAPHDVLILGGLGVLSIAVEELQSC